MISNSIESNIEDIEWKNQYRNKTLPDPKSLGEASSENYIDIKFNDSSIIKKNTHVDFNKKNLNNVRLKKIKCR